MSGGGEGDNGAEHILLEDRTSPKSVDVEIVEKGSKGSFCCGDEEPIEEKEKVSFFGLFRFADKLDILLMLAGALCMAAVGGVTPAYIFVFGDLMNKLIVFSQSPRSQLTSELNMTTSGTVAMNLTQCTQERLNRASGGTGMLTAESLIDELLNTYVVIFVCLAIGIFALAYLGMAFWVWTGHRQVRRVRTAYFHAVMRQSIGWFDVNEIGELNTRMVEDVNRLGDGFGNKMATFIQWIFTFIGGYALGFSIEWRFTLVILAASPLLVILGALLGRYTRTKIRKELQAYGKAGSVAEETFSSIRTVAAFGGEKKAEDKYAVSLQAASSEGIQKAAVGGVVNGLYWIIIFFMFGLAFWYGAKLTREECLDSGIVLQVFFGTLVGSITLGQAMPVLENFTNARAAAANLFGAIDAPVEIDSSSEEGIKADKLEGSIEFVDVNFAYPARKEIQVLKGLNLSVKKGNTVALVGESGCGKSTTIQLLQRYYECGGGQVLIDGKNLKEYNLTWLRNHMGIVSQEPILFATTIGENIKLGAKWGDEVTQEQMETAAKEANCYNFISELPQGFDTMVGERGVQLSGGQKQRIGIARALVKNPSILLLDEATSALDTQSEAIVQDALDRASKGRTTIVIAHRLSTIKTADQILAFKEGKVHEEGTHDELMAKEGIYHALVMQQLQRQKEEEEEKEKDKRRQLLRTLSRASRHSANSAPTSPDIDPSSPGLVERLPSLVENLAEEIDNLEEEPVDQGEDVAKPMLTEVIEPEATIGMLEILKMNRPEWHLIAFGSIASLIAGAMVPIYALIMSEIIGILSETDDEVQKNRVAEYVIYLVVTGLVLGIATMVDNSLLSLSGERLTMRLRKQCFATIVKQDIGFFDDEKNGVGYLTSRLASDASLVKGASGVRIGMIMQTLAAILGSVILSLYYFWELALLMVIIFPAILFLGELEAKMASGLAKAEKDSVAEGGKMAQEAIGNMRTVTSLNRQRYFTAKFSAHFKAIYKDEVKKSFVSGILYATSQAMNVVVIAICFGVGGYLVVCDCIPYRSEPVDFFHILRVFEAFTFTGIVLGRATSQLPDHTKANIAARDIKTLLSQQSAIDPTSDSGEKPASCDGNIQFKEVEFQYPTRRAIKVLQGVDFNVKRGEKLALVGSSGCGKSTSISLMERFYDAAAGVVSLDGKNVQELNLKWLRQQLGIVSQEPLLFDATIAENIAYGDNCREVDMTEIIAAATKANAHNFITSQPKGYETNVGAKGTQLSGGQKQRIAIARALVRNPKILLLDEATSALDTESEKIVQVALDQALEGRTAIIIAHRLSTIRNADKIGVIDSGEIMELGSHQELLAKKGFYFHLINAQL